MKTGVDTKKKEINSEKILYSRGGNDECYTPSYAVKPILKYIKPEWTVWCPFDKESSHFVREIGKNNNNVWCSHKDPPYEIDFLEDEPPFHFDCVISNPPFTNKRAFFERALSFGKPFALLMSNTWLNDKYSKWVFKEAGRQMQLLMFDKRIEFIQPNSDKKNKITFSSSYYCCDMLPRDIVIEELRRD